MLNEFTEDSSAIYDFIYSMSLQKLVNSSKKQIHVLYEFTKEWIDWINEVI